MTAISKSFSVLVALGLAACASSGSPATESTPAPQPAAAAAPAPAADAGAGPLYSTAQASRGRDLLRSMCMECHTATEFGDNTFKLKWSRRSVGDLYEFILTAMPDDAPGILTPAQAADLTAYVLEANGLEAGSRQLEPNQAELDEISLSIIRS